MKRKSLTFFYILTAAIFCFAVYFDNEILRTVFKPLPLIILIISIKPDTLYKKLIFTGFIFSLVGDIFLLKIIDLFIFGLAAFLVAHIFYTIAFIYRNSKIGITGLLIFYTVATILSYILFPYLNGLAVPVIIYIYVILTMVWRAFMQRNYNKTAIFAFLGAVLFSISDYNIAYTKFIHSYYLSEIVTIILYWTAQYLIAESIFRASGK